MSRILYGVSGEGAGHSSRAREIVPHLRKGGHDVRLVSYDRGYRVLEPLFGCLAINGLHIVSINNRVRPWRTLLVNFLRARQALLSVCRVHAEIRRFRPDVVITDFEPVTAWLARCHGLPLVSLDNQHRMRYMSFDTPPGMRRERRLTQWVIRCMVPSPDVALATTFFRGPVSNPRTLLFPPILRKAIRECRPLDGRHHLVYLTNHFDGLLATLRGMQDQHFVVYGCDREAEEGNLRFRRFSDRGFLEDLADARSVMGTAGFTLIGEALYLGKPYLAFPMHGQFEQQLNAMFLDKQGLGMNARDGSEEVIRQFLEKLPAYRRALSRYPFRHDRAVCRPDNPEIKDRLDNLLADDCHQLRKFRQSRITGSPPSSPISVSAD